MKKYLLILALALFALSANAKRTQATLSTDPNLHVGKLPNGLTYYILRNNTPPIAPISTSPNALARCKRATTNAAWPTS